MPDKCFEALDFSDVRTCLNSGNVIFSGNDPDGKHRAQAFGNVRTADKAEQQKKHKTDKSCASL